MYVHKNEDSCENRDKADPGKPADGVEFAHTCARRYSEHGDERPPHSAGCVMRERIDTDRDRLLCEWHY